MANGSNNNPFDSGAGTSAFGPGATGGLGGPGGDIFNQAVKNALGAQPGSPDYAYRDEILEMQREKAQQQAAKNYAQLRTLQTLGDIRNKIHQQELANLQQGATTGVAAGAAQLGQAQKLNQTASQTEQGTLQGYLGRLRSANLAEQQIQQEGIAALAGSTAEDKALADWIAKNDKGVLSKREFVHNFLTRFFRGLVGFHPETQQGIDWDKAKNDKELQSIFKELGIDITNKNFQNGIDNVVKKQTTSGGGWGFPKWTFTFPPGQWFEPEMWNPNLGG